MPRGHRGRGAGPPSNTLGKRNSATDLEAATGPSIKFRTSAGESSTPPRQQTGTKNSNKGTKKRRLLNTNERDHLVECVVEDDVLS